MSHYRVITMRAVAAATTAFAVGVISSGARADEKEGGGVITVTQQERVVNAWVWISGCPQEVQHANAVDLEIFDVAVAVEPDCALGAGTASGWQVSEILANGFLARGAGQLNVGTPQNNVIHSMGRSRFDIVFQLNEARRFSLSGMIAAVRKGTAPAAGNVAYTTVTLTSGGNQLFDQTVQPPLNNSQQATIEASGFVQPGGYRISVTSFTFVDQQFNNAFVQGQVEFDIVLLFTKAGDINRDGVVNVNDLLAVIQYWGECPAPCPPTCYGDATSDCAVNVNDLLMVLNDWG